MAPPECSKYFIVAILSCGALYTAQYEHNRSSNLASLYLLVEPYKIYINPVRYTCLPYHRYSESLK